MAYVIRSIGMGVFDWSTYRVPDPKATTPAIFADYSTSAAPSFNFPQFQCPTGDLVTSPTQCPGGAPAGQYDQMSTTDQLQYEIDALWNQLLGQSPTTPTSSGQAPMSAGKMLAIGGGIVVGLLVIGKAMR